MSVLNQTTAQQDQQYLVKVSSSDEQAGYLLSKLAAGSGITLTKLNSGEYETVEIGLNETEFGITTNKVAVSNGSGDGFLDDILEVDSPITKVSSATMTLGFDGALSDLNDCTIASASVGDLIQRDGTDFKNVPVATAIPTLNVVGDVETFMSPSQYDLLMRNGSSKWDEVAMVRSTSNLDTATNDNAPCSEQRALLVGSGNLSYQGKAVSGLIPDTASFVNFDCSGGDIIPTINTWQGRKITLFREPAIAGLDVILSDTSFTINGSTAYTLDNDHQSMTIVYNTGTGDWSIIAQVSGTAPSA